MVELAVWRKSPGDPILRAPVVLTRAPVVLIRAPGANNEGELKEYQSRQSKRQRLIQVARALHTCWFVTNDDNFAGDEKCTLSYSFPRVHRNTDKARRAFLHPDQSYLIPMSSSSLPVSSS